tara:strand:- start:2150 stop:2515 length:366 start_codon:yes stop_codon:yes gene_type:complete
MQFWVYLLQCADGKYYVGSHRGDDVGARVWEHNEGINSKAFTYSRRPVTLLWCGAFADPAEMVSFERQMKGWTRAKKEAFVQGDWERLKALSKSRTAPTVREKGRFYKLTHPDKPQDPDSS